MSDEPRPPRPATKTGRAAVDRALHDLEALANTDLCGFSKALRSWISGPGAALLSRDILHTYHRLQTLLKGRMAGESVPRDSLDEARSAFRRAVAAAVRRKLGASGELVELSRALAGEPPPDAGKGHG